MKLLVRLYADLAIGQKPVGIPDDWPAEVSEVDDSAEDPKDGRLLMDTIEFEAYKSSFKEAYDAWAEQVSLPVVKEELFKAVDADTSLLIKDGFEYKGKKFSLSMLAQTTLTSLYLVRDTSIITYPVKVNTADDLDSIELKNSDEVVEFYVKSVETARAHLTQGTILKDQIRTAATVDAADGLNVKR